MTAARRWVGDACQGPNPHRTPRLAAHPTTLKHKCPQSPKAPCGAADRAGGTAGEKAWEAGCVQEVRTEPQAPGSLAPGPSWVLTGFQRLPHLPGTTFIGDSGGSSRGRQGVGSGCGRVTGPSEVAASGQWQWRGGRRARSCAVSSSACVQGGGVGWAGGPGDINIRGQARPVICPDLEHDVRSESPGAHGLLQSPVWLGGACRHHPRAPTAVLIIRSRPAWGPTAEPGPAPAPRAQHSRPPGRGRRSPACLSGCGQPWEWA